MPITKAAIKANRQNIKRRKANLISIGKYKKALRLLKKLVEEKKVKEANEQLSVVYSELDKLYKKNIFSRNKVSRKKSQASKILSQINDDSKTVEKKVVKKKTVSKPKKTSKS